MATETPHPSLDSFRVNKDVVTVLELLGVTDMV
jgi:hypothetical protein